MKMVDAQESEVTWDGQGGVAVHLYGAAYNLCRLRNLMAELDQRFETAN